MILKKEAVSKAAFKGTSKAAQRRKDIAAQLQGVLLKPDQDGIAKSSNREYWIDKNVSFRRMRVT